MTKPLLLLLMAAITTIFGCATTTPVDKAKKALEEILPYPQFTDYRNVRTYPGGVVCGEFESPEANFRSVTGYRPFIFVGDQLTASNSKEAVSIFCSEDPVQALYEATGIAATGAENSALRKIQADLESLTSVLAEYKRLNRLYPFRGSNLSELVTDATVKGLIERIPNDPWGRPYNWSSIQWGGSATSEYRLWTYGQDNKEGGEGINADVSAKHLPYLRHISSLQTDK